MGLVPGPFDEASGVAAIREDGLHEGERSPRAFQHALRAVAVLDVGRVDFDCEQAAVGVGQDVTLAPMDLLSGVEAFEAPF
jgi:hypothetical protein